MKIYKCKLFKRWWTEESEDVPYEHIEEFKVVANPSSYLERTNWQEIMVDEPINFPTIGELRIQTTALDVAELTYFKVVDEVAGVTNYYHFQAFTVMVNSNEEGGILYSVQYILDMWMTHQNKRYRNLLKLENNTDLLVINCHSNRWWTDPQTGYASFNYIKYPQLRTLNTAIQTTAETIQDEIDAVIYDNADYQHELDIPMRFNVSISDGCRNIPMSTYFGHVTEHTGHKGEVYNDNSAEGDKLGFKYELKQGVDIIFKYLNSEVIADFSFENNFNTDFWEKVPTWREYDEAFRGEDGQWTYIVVPANELANIKDGSDDQQSAPDMYQGANHTVYDNQQFSGGSGLFYMWIPQKDSMEVKVKLNNEIRYSHWGFTGNNWGRSTAERVLTRPSQLLKIADYEALPVSLYQYQFELDDKFSKITVNTFAEFENVWENYSGRRFTNKGDGAYVKIKCRIPPSQICWESPLARYKKAGDDHIYQYPIFITNDMVCPFENIGVNANDKGRNKSWAGATNFHWSTNTCILLDFGDVAVNNFSTNATFFKKARDLVNTFYKLGNKTPTLPQYEPLLFNEWYFNCQISFKNSGQGQLNYSMLDMLGTAQLDEISYQSLVTDKTYYKWNIPTYISVYDTKIRVLCADYPMFACQEELLFQDDRTYPSNEDAYNNYLANNPTTMDTSRNMANIAKRQDIMNNLVNAGVSVYSGTNLLKASVLASNATNNAEINYNKEQKQIDSQVANIMSTPGSMSLPPYIGSMFNTGVEMWFTSYLSPKSEKQVFNYFAAYGYIQNSIIPSNRLWNREKFNYVKIDGTFNSQKLIEKSNEGINPLFLPYEYGKNFLDRLTAGIRVHRGGLWSYDISTNYENEQPNFNIVEQGWLYTRFVSGSDVIEQSGFDNVEIDFELMDQTVNSNVNKVYVNNDLFNDGRLHFGDPITYKSTLQDSTIQWKLPDANFTGTTIYPVDISFTFLSNPYTLTYNATFQFVVMRFTVPKAILSIKREDGSEVVSFNVDTNWSNPNAFGLCIYFGEAGTPEWEYGDGRYMNDNPVSIPQVEVQNIPNFTYTLTIYANGGTDVVSSVDIPFDSYSVGDLQQITLHSIPGINLIYYDGQPAVADNGISCVIQYENV